MNRLKPFDVVRLPAGLAAYGIPENATAVVLNVHEDPYLAYEIEVVGAEGETLFTGAVDAECVDLVESFSEGTE